MSRQFDLVVFGATGFTGRLVVEYLLANYPAGSGVRWAMGGRSAEKLAAVRDEIGAPADTRLVITDSTNPTSLNTLVESTRVVLTTVGPYQLYGSELVAACAAAGTDYVDLCGEPVWMRQMIDAHESAAKASGARIVFSCGFDSIPFDLGVLFLQDASQKKYSAPASRVRGRVRAMKGTFSGGTAASFKATMVAAGGDQSVGALLRDPFALTPGFTGPSQPTGHKPMLDEALGMWVAPFIMAVVNTRNVHRSNFLLGQPYDADFVYDEMVLTGAGEKGEAIAKAMSERKGLGKADDLQPGEGPSREERESGMYDVLFVGHTAKGEEVRVGVTGDRDPGYGSTSKMIAEAAIHLLDPACATGGGIWTPASAMGLPLVERLQKSAGLRFSVEA